jgi:hypothetical protein
MRNLMKLALVAILNLATIQAWAIPFTATMPDAIGPMRGTSGPLSYVIENVNSPGASAAGGATLTFDVIGYGGIDGYGPRINANDVYDTFTFVTGATFFSVALNMGGSNPGPAYFVSPNPDVTLVSYTDNGPGQGGLAQFSVAFSLLSGDNGLIFQYGCCSPSNGTEEGWGLRNVVITADLPGQPLTNGVPEPMTLSLLLAGLIGIGAMSMARRQSAAV